MHLVNTHKIGRDQVNAQPESSSQVGASIICKLLHRGCQVLPTGGVSAYDKQW